MATARSGSRGCEAPVRVASHRPGPVLRACGSSRQLTPVNRLQQPNSSAEQTEVQSVKTVKTAPSSRAVPGYAAVISAPRRVDVCEVGFVHRPRAKFA